MAWEGRQAGDSEAPPSPSGEAGGGAAASPSGWVATSAPHRRSPVQRRQHRILCESVADSGSTASVRMRTAHRSSTQYFDIVGNLVPVHAWKVLLLAVENPADSEPENDSEGAREQERQSDGDSARCRQLLAWSAVSRAWKAAVRHDNVWRAMCPLGTLKLQTHTWLEVYKQMHLLRSHDVTAAAALERKERDVLGRAALSARSLAYNEGPQWGPTSPSCGGMSPTYEPTSPTYTPTSPSYDPYDPPSPLPNSPAAGSDPSSPPPPTHGSTDNGMPSFPADIAHSGGGLLEGLQVCNEALMQDAAALLQLSGEIYGQMRQLGEQHQVTAYLNDSIGRYERFMSLKAQDPSALLVPTRDIEAVWMSHLIRPVTPLCLSLSLSLSVSLSLSLSLALSLSLCLWLSLSLSLSLSLTLSLTHTHTHFLFLSLSFSLCLSVHLSLHLSLERKIERERQRDLTMVLSISRYLSACVYGHVTS